MSTLTDARVLVTGASGLLGAGIARALVDAGATVTTLQRRASGVVGARDIRGSVTDPSAVSEAMSDVDSVIHVAAKVSVSGAAEDFERVNVDGTRLVLEAAQAAGVQRFIHFSSPSVAHAGSSLVGVTAGRANPETARGHYARTKARGEQEALSFDADDFRVLVLRPHLMWGPGDTQLTERIIDRARSGRMPILGSGAALIDTLYWQNAVDAAVAALKAVDTHHGQAIVITNGEPRPVGELLRAIAVAGGAVEPRLRIPASVAKIAGAAIERVWDADLWGIQESGWGTSDGEPPLTRFLAEQLSTAHWFDQRHTRDVLQWSPKISIDQGLVLLAQHYQR